LISGRDALLKGEGRFDIMALGVIPLARAAHTAALVRGELIRYLAEIAWAPQAILHNPALRWEVIDADTLSVGAGSDETACRVLVSLDGDGRTQEPSPRIGRAAQWPRPCRRPGADDSRTIACMRAIGSPSPPRSPGKWTESP